MKINGTIILSLVAVLLFFTGCSKELEDTEQKFSARGTSYEMQLPVGWKADKEVRSDYGLQTTFSAEDTKSNSYLFITTTPATEVAQEGFGEKTREKLKERYNYKNLEGIYMKKIKVGEYPAYKYTLNTVYKEKSVWAHFYYIWTENSFVQMTFYSADDNSYEKRSERIDAAVATLKEVSFDEKEAEKSEESQEKAEGDIITIENDELKMETTGVRQVRGTDQQKLLAIRYNFTNLGADPVQPSIWQELVTASQNGRALPVAKLPEDSAFLDVKDLADAQTKMVSQGETVECVVLYDLSDQSTIELSFSQEAFPGRQAARVVIPK
ncbi:DUF5067 domain-containing protein [Enterococcus ureasiticus]|uniref:DUF5067 domain-containing protein n=1 Tax=Enterococcus ureasiticus TaxID=903984 RepID=A0A1E5GA50_9ENTE|nr:DUF5067 domain-containing protein [Enterococcus ureasiticus]OEG09537.1 DUF5067 domain-containing protein [Enterococcus ureasiticus]